MWRYVIRTGALYRDGKLVTHGYSGLDDGDGIPEPGEGKNDPAAQDKRGIGPIPVGLYIIGPPESHPSAGPYTLRLGPTPGTDTHGRSGFLIHGDARVPGTASHGCIIMPRWVRVLIWSSGDHSLRVVAEAT